MRIKLGFPYTLYQIRDACGLPLIFPIETNPRLQAVSYLTTDSRQVERGDLFVALSQKEDIKEHLTQAQERGASLILCPKGYEGGPTAPCMPAENVMEALGQFALAHSQSIPHKTVAVTGSVGKTTTRHFLGAVLGRGFTVHESPLNYNNLLGTCLTLLTMPRSCQVLVAECGMDGEGQIKVLSQLLHPDYAVITNCGISHMEKLGSREAIRRAKLEILEGMRGGRLYIDADPNLIKAAPSGAITVSRTVDTATCFGEVKDIHPRGILFSYRDPKVQIEDLSIHTHGLHTLSCALFAVAIGVEMGLTQEQIRHGLASYLPVPMRQSILSLNGATVILDAYNACPDSMTAACEALCQMCPDPMRRKAILGDMLELGEDTPQYHLQIGSVFAKKGFASLVFVGDYAQAYMEGALNAGMSPTSLSDYEKNALNVLKERLSQWLKPGEFLLIKGSRACRLENILPDHLIPKGDHP